MDLISFRLACRNCLQTDNNRYIYEPFIKDSSVDYTTKSEYEMMIEIEHWVWSHSHQCQNCSSTNEEVLDIEVNNRPLYCYESLVQRCFAKREYMVMFNVQKSGGLINITPGGNERFNPDFIMNTMRGIIELILERPNDNYISQIRGNFFICLTGKYDYLENRLTIRNERFRSHGLTRKEILDALRPYAVQYGLPSEICDLNQDIITDILDGSKFSGALFNLWFYNDTNDTKSFKYDEDTLVVYGVDNEGSPRDFMDNNKNQSFIIDKTKDSVFRDGKKVFFAKRNI